MAIIELLDGEFECQVLARMTIFPFSGFYECVFIRDLNMDVDGKELLSHDVSLGSCAV